MRRTLVAGAAIAGVLAACSDADPCAGATTCVRLDVDSVLIEAIDQLELDVVYEGLHATTTTGTAGNPVGLPLALPLTLDLPGSPLIHIDLVAAGRLDGRVIAADATSTTVQQGTHAAIDIFLEPIEPCTETSLYCGNINGPLGDGQTLYRCTAGLPIFYARCSSGCFPHSGRGGECVGLGLCRDGGTYCGGHALDGDPHVLYVCKSFDGITPRLCPDGCLVRGDGDDACQ